MSSSLRCISILFLVSASFVVAETGHDDHHDDDDHHAAHHTSAVEWGASFPVSAAKYYLPLPAFSGNTTLLMAVLPVAEEDDDDHDAGHEAEHGHEEHAEEAQHALEQFLGRKWAIQKRPSEST